MFITTCARAIAAPTRRPTHTRIHRRHHDRPSRAGTPSRVSVRRRTAYLQRTTASDAVLTISTSPRHAAAGVASNQRRGPISVARGVARGSCLRAPSDRTANAGPPPTVPDRHGRATRLPGAVRAGSRAVHFLRDVWTHTGL